MVPVTLLGPASSVMEEGTASCLCLPSPPQALACGAVVRQAQASLWPCLDLRRANLLGQTQVSMLPVAGGLELGARDGLQRLQLSLEKRKVELGLTLRSPGSPCSLTPLQTPWPWGRSQQGRGAMARILEVGNRLSEMAVS